VEDALRTLVRVRSEERKREHYEERIASLEQRTSRLTLRDSAHELIRRDRERG